MDSVDLVVSNRSQQRINDVLSALGEVIRSQQDPSAVHEPTPTEYFVIIFRSLASNSEINEHVQDLLAILNAVVPKTAKSIIREQFKPVSVLLSKIIQKAESAKVIRLALEVLGSALELQDTSDGFWGNIHTLKIVNMYVGLLDDNRPKIKKVAFNKLSSILREHKRVNARSLASYVGDFCLEIIKACSRSEYKRSVSVIVFLEQVLPFFQNDSILKIVEASLRLPSCNQPVLSASMLRMLDSFFQNPYLALPASYLFECIRMVIAMPPETLDMEANTYYCTALASGLLRMHSVDKTSLPELLVAGVMCLVRSCEAEFTQIHCAVATALKRLITGCFDEILMSEALASAPSTSSIAAIGTGLTPLHRVLSSIENLCQLRFQQSWLYIMDAIRCLFETIRGDRAVILLGAFVIKLADVNQAIETGMVTVDAAIAIAISDTLGTILKSLGVVNFLALVPFSTNSGTVFTGIDPAREWILSVMHSTLRTMPCALEEFGAAILTTARLCNQAIQAPEKYHLTALKTQQVRNRVLQLWSLFPDFCNFGCRDIPASFPKLVKILAGAMKDVGYPELLPFVVLGLTNLARVAREKSMGRDSPDVVALRVHATTFLPALLEFLETVDISDNRFQSGVQCVAAWIAIAAPGLVSAVTRRLLQLLLTSTHAMAEASSAMDISGTGIGAGAAQANENVAAGWMAVLQAIIPNLSSDLVTLLYKTVRPLLSVDESVSIQKRAYHVLEGLLEHHQSTVHQTEERLSILAVISESLLTCHVSARNMRLRCIETLVKSLTDDEIAIAADSLLGEILICQKDANQKTRTAAMGLLKTLVARLPSNGLFLQLCSAVVGETAVMRSSGIIGLCVLLLGQRQDEALLVQAATLLPTVCILLQEECVEQTRAILSFVRVCTNVLPPTMLMENLQNIIFAITSGLGSLKSKFASRVRAVMRKLSQKVGGLALQPIVPESDQPLLTYILKQARRSTRRKQLKEQTQKDEISKMLGSGSEDESGNDGDDDDGSINQAMERPKALRPKDVMISSLPTTLDNLLEDQPASFMAAVSGSSALSSRTRVRAKRPNGAAASSHAAGASTGPAVSAEDVDDADGDGFDVVVSADGKVCVQAKALAPAVSVGTKAKGGAMEVDGENDNGSDSKKQAPSSDSAGKRQRVREPGEEYRSKKAGGDVWKKGMLEPHAYIPLDPRLMSKKHRDEAMTKFGGVVGGAGTGRKKIKSIGKTRMVVGNRKQRRNDRESKVPSKKRS